MYRTIKVVLLRKLCKNPFNLPVRCKKKNVLFKYVFNIIIIEVNVNERTSNGKTTRNIFEYKFNSIKLFNIGKNFYT